MARPVSCVLTPGPALLLCLQLLFALVQHLQAQLDTPEVIADTSWGRIYGQRKKTRDALEYYSFEGIPYALPPLGFLRFAKPVPVIGRTLNPYKAYAVKPSCYGVGVTGPVSEDCLYLDIYVPGTPHQRRKSVMVFFHGGGFVTATPQPSVDAIMSQGGTILVVVHYRLGPFGFLSGAERFLKGNFGLWDQTMALRWVRSNIAAFGGDPGKVTIFGSSAGAASVAYHVLAPPSKRFFQRAIMMSGSASATWAIQRDPRPVARQLAENLNCSYPSDAVTDIHVRALVVTCLRLLKAEQIFQAGLNLFLTQSTATKLVEFLFVPVVDGEFVLEDPRVMLDNHTYLMNQGVIEKDIIVGVANNEGSLLFGNSAVPKPPDFGDFFDKDLIPRLLFQRYGVPASASAVRAVSEYYSANIPRQFLSALGVAHAYADPAFVIPAIEFSRSIGDFQTLLKGRGKTYFYYFDYCPFYTGALCMMHGLDNLYLFPPFQFIDASDDKITRMFVELLTSFSASGVPRAADLGLRWATFSSFTGNNVLRLNGSPEMKPDLFSHKEEFWLKRVPTLISQNR
ncbi:carboxylic ester hydrolase [Elysia marginata]|uniref:Carboxylic ester hydrolase n=1 Tax=Elysia marginata TaxID=1093978 RepID=A0AAV4JCT6_9GAST|nr:carboxylic ester hydrolase [Elysia marginata]